MWSIIKKIIRKDPGEINLKKRIKFQSTIYGQVVIIITILSIILFFSFGLIFRSVYEQYINTIIRQNGNNIGSLIKGALYQSMMDNDKKTLQNTLDIINTMPGIKDVNLYDGGDNLVYSSFAPEAEGHIDPNCKNCHEDFSSMFPAKEKSYKIIDGNSECQMSKNSIENRHLLIRTPILNERSCYTSSCHAHAETDEVLGSLIVKIPLEELDAAVKKSSAEFYIFATFTTLLLVSFLIFFTWKAIKKPLNALVNVSDAVAKGDRNSRVEIKPNQLEDMRMVSQAFNDMLDNLQAANEELKNWSQQLEYKVQKKSEELGAVQNEIIHVERLASLGKLSSSVAHEINNPLSGILIYTKLIYKQLSNPDLYASKRESMLQHLKMIESETKRCGDIVKGLLDFSRKDQDDFEPKHLNEILHETYDLMAHPVKIANIAFISDLSAKSDLIYCSPNQVKQACVALIVNATEAISENGEITIRTSNPENDTIKIEIADNGIGISEEDIPHVFEPFFSTKQDASGIGLGLPIVHGIIQNHKGKILVKSELGQGTTISIIFPLINT
ncbi:MAG: HAMP domain-containing protein [Bacteroidales bacterium]|nr:HAMP domain-containing protein [Bacteroidales bacterium]